MRNPVRVRERLVWKPTWDKTYQKWTEGFMRANAWRCDKVNTVDDLMQEAFLVFQYVSDSYPRVTDPAYFFSIYKRSIINKMHDWSCRKRRRKDIEPVALPADVNEFFIGRIGETANGGYLTSLIKEMPEELTIALDYLSGSKRGALKPRLNAQMRDVAIGKLRAMLTA